ncbi:hypothetical protein GW17_00033495 [Ensete ventricosum]|nr:hypothetical protein GW17_00033495 [Ensete ventricosum]
MAVSACFESGYEILQVFEMGQMGFVQAAEKLLARLGIIAIGRADTEGGEETVGFSRDGTQPRAFPIEVASWPFDVHHEGEIKPSRCSASSKVKLEGSHPEQKSPSRWRRGGVLSDSVEDGGEGNPNTTGVAQSRRPNRTGYREGQGFVSLSGRYLSCPLVLLMARKRKLEAMGLDEADRTLYSTFCAAANSLSQVYAQAMNQQKISFQAGERHALVSSYRSQFAVA